MAARSAQQVPSASSSDFIHTMAPARPRFLAVVSPVAPETSVVAGSSGPAVCETSPPSRSSYGRRALERLLARLWLLGLLTVFIAALTICKLSGEVDFVTPVASVPDWMWHEETATAEGTVKQSSQAKEEHATVKKVATVMGRGSDKDITDQKQIKDTRSAHSRREEKLAELRKKQMETNRLQEFQKQRRGLNKLIREERAAEMSLRAKVAKQRVDDQARVQALRRIGETWPEGLFAPYLLWSEDYQAYISNSTNANLFFKKARGRLRRMRTAASDRFMRLFADAAERLGLPIIAHAGSLLSFIRQGELKTDDTDFKTFSRFFKNFERQPMAPSGQRPPHAGQMLTKYGWYQDRGSRSRVEKHNKTVTERFWRQQGKPPEPASWVSLLVFVTLFVLVRRQYFKVAGGVALVGAFIGACLVGQYCSATAGDTPWSSIPRRFAEFGVPGEFGYEVGFVVDGHKIELFVSVEEQHSYWTGLWVSSRLYRCELPGPTDFAPAVDVSSGTRFWIPTTAFLELEYLYGAGWTSPFNGSWDWAKSVRNFSACDMIQPVAYSPDKPMYPTAVASWDSALRQLSVRSPTNLVPAEYVGEELAAAIAEQYVKPARSESFEEVCGVLDIFNPS